MGEIDTRFPIDDDYGDEDEPTDEEIEEAFAAAEAEENDGESDYDSEDYDYEESRKPTKTEKPENKGKRMFERRNRPSMQKSLFDAFETKTPEQELTEQILKGGSGVSGGKIRIYTEYLKNPYEKISSVFKQRIRNRRSRRSGRH